MSNQGHETQGKTETFQSKADYRDLTIECNFGSGMFLFL